MKTRSIRCIYTLKAIIGLTGSSYTRQISLKNNTFKLPEEYRQITTFGFEETKRPSQLQVHVCTIYLRAYEQGQSTINTVVASRRNAG